MRDSRPAGRQLGRLRLFPEDCGGVGAIAFERDDFGGQALTITSDFMDLDDEGGPCGGDWDDCISSIQVFPPG